MNFLYLKWTVYYISLFLLNRIKSLINKTMYLLKIFNPNSENTLIKSAFNRFIKVNSKFWKSRNIEITNKSQSYVLIECLVNHPGYLMINLIIGKYFMEVYNMQGAGLLLKPDRKQELLLKSYGIDIFYYLSDRKKSLLQNFKYIFWSINLLKKNYNIDSFLKLEINGINIGKTVYDNYLRRSGVGTVEKFNKGLFKCLVEALGHYEFCQKLFERKLFPILIQAEKQFIPCSIVFQSALKYGCVIYNRGGGPHNITLRRFDDINQTYMNTFRFSRELYNYVLQNYREKATTEGEQIITKRFAGESGSRDIPDAALAFKKDQPIVSRKELCRRFDWDYKVPIIGIFANNLTDGVFTNRWALFRDNLQWLRQTLKHVKNVTDVNWFVKPHPSDIKNKVKTDTRGEYEKWVQDCQHIRFLPVDIGGNSLPKITDVVLTAHGSAGIEYPCFGIPTIVAGESLYTGLGFSYEPKTKEEYFMLLNNIKSIKLLEVSQIDRAKSFVYIYLKLSRGVIELLPVYSPFDDYNERKLWIDAEKKINSIDNTNEEKLKNMIRVQIKKCSRHLLNYDWIDLI